MDRVRISNGTWFFLDDHRADAGRLGLWLGRQAGRGRWLFSGSQSWTLFMPNPFFLPSVGGECKESTDGVSYRQRPPTVGENLFETWFGLCVNEII